MPPAISDGLAASQLVTQVIAKAVSAACVQCGMTHEQFPIDYGQDRRPLIQGGGKLDFVLGHRKKQAECEHPQARHLSMACETNHNPQSQPRFLSE